ncbi:hypothetical protein C8F04DRAFT_1194424 [Mycena alexandri]|uniref:Uncharacterized protein n=1 Tax=Mycena alexandri TaxID=1745969 RepID=A0AAD6S7W7_9AGAR|nr:hypothetical protein C8F04DRAFT_1194424 [Mycena alexandri]
MAVGHWMSRGEKVVWRIGGRTSKTEPEYALNTIKSNLAGTISAKYGGEHLVYWSVTMSVTSRNSAAGAAGPAGHTLADGGSIAIISDNSWMKTKPRREKKLILNLFTSRKYPNTRGCIVPAGNSARPKRPGLVKGRGRGVSKDKLCQFCKGQRIVRRVKITNHSGFTSLLVTDLQSVVAVVGRIQTRGKWALVDRTGGLIRPQFIEADAEEEDPEGE